MSRRPFTSTGSPAMQVGAWVGRRAAVMQLPPSRHAVARRPAEPFYLPANPETAAIGPKVRTFSTWLASWQESDGPAQPVLYGDRH